MVASGHIVGIYLKPRVPQQYGLPKASVPSVEILRTGLEGDFNNYRQAELHGDPDSAVLLMTQETVEALRAEGWPVTPGDLGENLLVKGIRYDELAPSRTLRVGEGVTLATTRACTPCDRLFTLPYVGPERGPAFLKAMLDRRGWYARVVHPGSVRVGDAISLA